MKRLAKLLCLMLSLALLLGSCGTGSTLPSEAESDTPSVVSEPVSEPVQSEEPSEDETSEPEVPIVFRAIACSDTHVHERNFGIYPTLSDVFSTAYEYAESHPSYKTIDAVMVAGDLTNYGRAAELSAFKEMADAYLKDHPETTLLTVMGNHEYYEGGQEVYKKEMDSELDKHVVINGFHIIGLSTRGDDNYTDEQLSWLEAELKKAAEDDPEKPIFTFQHHHLQNTVYVSRSWYTSASSRFKKIYSKYPQVINFSGHSHGPINNPRSIWQEGFTMLGTGTLAYFEMESDMTEKTVPNDADNAGQYYIIEVDAKNSVRILPYNIIKNDFFRNPANKSGRDEQLIYTIPKPSDPATFHYTAKRGEYATEPEFPNDAELRLYHITSSSVRLIFPSALDDSCIYGYRAVCTAPDGTRYEFSRYARYYIEPLPEEQNIPISGLRSGTEYTVELYPINVWYKEGKPLTAKFTTKEKESIEYKSENPVTYSGTFTDFESLDELTRTDSSFAYGGRDLPNGDVFGGNWNSDESDDKVALALAKGKGFGGSTALEVSYNGDAHINRGLYVFATEVNHNTVVFPEFAYLRLWVDFTGIDFRKACFGLVNSRGDLFSTDDLDYMSDSPFYYLPDGGTEWKRYQHGSDGCFGVAEGASVKDFKGWLAFPVNMFGARSGDTNRFDDTAVLGVYMYWDLYSDTMLGKPFYLDEIHLVYDYKKFNK